MVKLNSKIEFSIYINIILLQEKLGTERKNYSQTNVGGATYLLDPRIATYLLDPRIATYLLDPRIATYLVDTWRSHICL